MDLMKLLTSSWKYLVYLLHDSRGSVSLTGELPGGGSDGDVGGDSGVRAPEVASASQQAPDSVSVTGSQAEPTNFLTGLDEEIVNDPSLKVFQGEEGFNVQNLIKSYVHAQKKIGEKGIQVPDKYATEEDWANYYNQLRPAELDKYEVKQPEEGDPVLDEEMFTEFKQNAHKLGMTTKQAQEIYNWYDGSIRKAVEMNQNQAKQAYEQEIASLQEDWGQGDAFKKEMTLAQRALNEFADDGLKEALKKTGLDQNVTLVRLFNRIGKALMTEDKFNQESHGTFGYTKSEAERKIAQIYGDQSHAYWDPKHPEHRFAVEEMSKLHQVGIQE